jgi:hypothetical protein
MASPLELLQRGQGWSGCAIPSDPPGGYHTAARGRASERGRRFGRWLPLGCRVVGLSEVDGMQLRDVACGYGPEGLRRRPYRPEASCL